MERILLTLETLAGRVERRCSLRKYVLLRAGGPAERLLRVAEASDLAGAAILCQQHQMPSTVLGWGSNVLPADKGVPGMVLINEAKRIEIEGDRVIADSGCSFQELFLKVAQRALTGLEYAVGIPGSLGGALVSNAGAYRSNVSEFLTRLEVVESGVLQWIAPERMEFAYRDSILRRADPPSIVIVRVEMRLPQGKAKDIYDEAREYQRQRISKQPPQASAGSFFKNVNDPLLAETLPSLPKRLREAGVVPAGFLLEAAGMSGSRCGGAMFSPRHANFIVNARNATAGEIRTLAEIAKHRVRQRFGARLDEEVMYLGDWSDWRFEPKATTMSPVVY